MPTCVKAKNKRAKPLLQWPTFLVTKQTLKERSSPSHHIAQSTEGPPPLPAGFIQHVKAAGGSAPCTYQRAHRTGRKRQLGIWSARACTLFFTG